jgi:hypothetical protein
VCRTRWNRYIQASFLAPFYIIQFRNLDIFIYRPYNVKVYYDVSYSVTKLRSYLSELTFFNQLLKAAKFSVHIRRIPQSNLIMFNLFLYGSSFKHVRSPCCNICNKKLCLIVSWLRERVRTKIC